MDYNKCIELSHFRRLRPVLESSVMDRGKLRLGKQVSEEDLRIIYKCFRASMLDGYIPIKKPIGFIVESRQYPQSANIVSRHPCLLESQLKMMENLSKLIVVGNCASEVTTDLLQGKIKASNLGIQADGKPVRFLDPSVSICSAIKPIRIKMIINENVGYKIMEESYHSIDKLLKTYGKEENRCIPLNVQHSLFDYIRVLPFNRKEIRYTLVGNISEKDMNDLWHKFINIREKR